MRSMLVPLALGTGLALSSTLVLSKPPHATEPGWNGPVWQQQAALPLELVQATLRERGFGRVLGMQPKKHHVEVYTTRNGEPIEVKLTLDGRFHEWELPKHQRYAGASAATPIDDPVAVAAEAGYESPRLGEYKRHHVEVFAANARGENVELHMAPSGLIYKEKQIQSWFDRPSGWGR
ncbi:hypothetical protein [Panacagrimonas sp.]|uniref:hypothetical protein n=1 Tax=Panacagrimonas sp. TaxID=2480088 RepID=UPI003B51BD29